MLLDLTPQKNAKLQGYLKRAQPWDRTVRITCKQRLLFIFSYLYESDLYCKIFIGTEIFVNFPLFKYAVLLYRKCRAGIM